MEAPQKKRLRAAVDGLAHAKQEREDAIVEAWLNGYGSIGEISEITGMSTTGVAQLLERRGVRKRFSRAEQAEMRRKWARGEIDRL